MFEEFKFLQTTRIVVNIGTTVLQWKQLHVCKTGSSLFFSLTVSACVPKGCECSCSSRNRWMDGQKDRETDRQIDRMDFKLDQRGQRGRQRSGSRHLCSSIHLDQKKISFLKFDLCFKIVSIPVV